FAADRPGTATFVGTATTDADADAVELSLPVLPFGLKRTKGSGGSIVGPGEGRAELTVPESANTAERSIRVSLAPSLAGALLVALDFLTSYPYGCTEQILSGFLPNVVVLQAMSQLKIAPTERLRLLDRQVSEGLRRLYDYQHDDGGWGWWRTDENHPFMTAYATYGLVETRKSGYQVESWRIRDGVFALQRMYAEYPRAVPDLKAYMAYVIALARATKVNGEALLGPYSGDYDQAGALNELWDARGRMSNYGRANLLLALDAAGDRRGGDLARELGEAAERKGDLAWWPAETDPLLEDYGDTSVEATALILKALAARDSKHPLLEPAARWLMLNRSYGRYWASTKQTAMALYGLLEYMRARGEGAAETTVDVFVNGQAAGTRTFTAADLTAPDPVILTAPATQGTNAIRIVKRGEGALYWSAEAHYFDRAGPLERTGSSALALVRTYAALSPVRAKDGRIVYRESPLSSSVAPGNLLLVRLTAAGSADWRYLMIEDPLPAGAEPIKQAQLYELEGDARSRWFRWYSERREYRDDRVVFFERDLRDGRMEFSYLLKVVTPGSFQAMPAQIAPMYVPDVHASSGVQSLVVVSPGAPGPDSRQVPR
ncbi:MAG: alpha-2-macroglobulin, partial [Acidobacteria bacterium]